MIGNLVFPPSTATSEEIMAWTLTYEGDPVSTDVGLISGIVVAGVIVLVSVVIIIVLITLLTIARRNKAPDTK